MKKIIEFPLEMGGSVFVEIDEPLDESGLIPAARPDAMQKYEGTFEAALNKVGPLANAVLAKLHSLIKEPDELEVQLGLKLNTSVGVVLACAETEANLLVRIMWKSTESKSA